MTKEEKVIGAIAKGPGMSPNEYQRLAPSQKPTRASAFFAISVLRI